MEREREAEGEGEGRRRSIYNEARRDSLAEDRDTFACHNDST